MSAFWLLLSCALVEGRKGTATSGCLPGQGDGSNIGEHGNILKHPKNSWTPCLSSGPLLSSMVSIPLSLSSFPSDFLAPKSEHGVVGWVPRGRSSWKLGTGPPNLTLWGKFLGEIKPIHLSVMKTLPNQSCSAGNPQKLCVRWNSIFFSFPKPINPSIISKICLRWLILFFFFFFFPKTRFLNGQFDCKDEINKRYKNNYHGASWYLYWKYKSSAMKFIGNTGWALPAGAKGSVLLADFGLGCSYLTKGLNAGGCLCSLGWLNNSLSRRRG